MKTGLQRRQTLYWVALLSRHQLSVSIDISLAKCPLGIESRTGSQDRYMQPSITTSNTDVARFMQLPNHFTASVTLNHCLDMFIVNYIYQIDLAQNNLHWVERNSHQLDGLFA